MPNIKSPWILLAAAVVLGFALTQFAGGPSPVSAVEANFLKGIYSTDAGCKKFEANAAAKKPDLVGEDRPTTIERNGMFGVEWSCEYASIDRVSKRKTYIATMFCLDAGDPSVDHMTMEMEKDKTMRVKQGDGEPVMYRRCKIKK